MIDKNIKVGDRWVTRGGATVRILATDAEGGSPIVGQVLRGAAKDTVMLWKASGEHSSGDLPLGDLISLAPSTVKREVALYRCDGCVLIFDAEPGERLPADLPNEYRISEPRTIEFTLLPGESADA